IKRMSSSHPLDKHMQQLIEYKIELAYKSLEASVSFSAPRARPNTQDINIIEETDEELAERIANAEADAEREYFMGRLSNIVSREGAKVNDVPEPELTIKRKAMLRDALEYMLER